MKQRFVFVLATLLFIFSTGLVSAEDDVRSPKPILQRLQNVKQEVAERTATREANKKERLTELRKNIVTNFFNVMVKRLQAATDRLNKILERIESRIAKIKSENPNKDLSQVDSEVSNVRTKLTNVQVKINNLKSSFDTAIVSDNPKDDFKKILADVSLVKEDLQDIRRSLSKIIGDIKGLHVGESETESPKP